MGLFKKLGRKIAGGMTKAATKTVNKKYSKPINDLLKTEAGQKQQERFGNITGKLLTTAAIGAGAISAAALAPAAIAGTAATKAGALGAGTGIKSGIAAGGAAVSKMDKIKRIGNVLDKGGKIAGNLKKTATLLNRNDVVPGNTEPELNMIPEQFLPGGLPAGDLQDRPMQNSMPTLTASGMELNPYMIGGMILAIIVLALLARNNG